MKSSKSNSDWQCNVVTRAVKLKRHSIAGYFYHKNLKKLEYFYRNRNVCGCQGPMGPSALEAEIDGIVTDSMQFLSGIEFTLHHGLPHEKLAALRQCIKKIWVNKPAGEIKLVIYLVPVGNLQATQEFKMSV